MRRVRVLVVDDSPTMRAIIKHNLQDDPEIEIIGEAADPYEAREKIKALLPDVITLDVEMPHLSGMEFLEKLMRLRPTPVIMVSALTQKGGAASIDALALGAFDCVAKPSDGDFHNAFPGLARKVKLAAKSPIRRQALPITPANPTFESYEPNDRIIAIGASTGGVEAVTSVLSVFPANCPTTIITQHMPPSFTASFAARLNKTCAPEVMEAYEGAPLNPGCVYIAPGGYAHLEIRGAGAGVCRLTTGDPVSGHRPSVDVMFRSVAKYGDRVVAVILTGMGRDGASGMLEIRKAGGRTLGQNAATSTVYGMPRIAFEIGAVEQQLRVSEIGRAALKLCSNKRAVA